MHTGATDIDDLITTAAFFGNVDIFRMLIKLSKNVDYNNIARISIINNNIEIFKIALDHIISDISVIVLYAIKYKRIDILEMLTKDYKVNYNAIADRAMDENNLEVLNWAKNHLQV